MKFFGLEMTHPLSPPFLDIFSKIYDQNIPFWNQKNLQCNFLDRKWHPTLRSFSKKTSIFTNPYVPYQHIIIILSPRCWPDCCAGNPLRFSFKANLFQRHKLLSHLAYFYLYFCLCLYLAYLYLYFTYACVCIWNFLCSPCPLLCRQCRRCPPLKISNTIKGTELKVFTFDDGECIIVGRIKNAESMKCTQAPKYYHLSSLFSESCPFVYWYIIFCRFVCFYFAYLYIITMSYLSSLFSENCPWWPHQQIFILPSLFHLK